MRFEVTVQSILDANSAVCALLSAPPWSCVQEMKENHQHKRALSRDLEQKQREDERVV